MNVARTALVAVLASLLLASAAQAKSEFAVFALSAEGQGQGAFLNPVGEGCVGDGQQTALRGSMRESLRVSTPKATLVTISGLIGNRGPMRITPLDRRQSAPTAQVDITRDGQVEYLDCKPGMTYAQCPEVASRTRPECHVARPVNGLEGCFGSRTFTTTLGIALTGSQAQLIVSSPSALESSIFACQPEDQSFRPSSLIPGSSSLRTTGVALPRKTLQRAKPGTEIVLRGAHTPGRDHVPGCKVAAPATCEAFSGQLTMKLKFVCRARRTTQSCAKAGGRRGAR